MMIKNLRELASPLSTLYAEVKTVVTPQMMSFTNLFINIGMNAYLVVFGLKSLLLDAHPTWFWINCPKSFPKIVQKICQAVNWFTASICSNPNNNGDQARFSLHGIAMIISGLAGIIFSACEFGMVSLAVPLVSIIGKIAASFFIFANLIFLEQDIENFIKAVNQIVKAGTLNLPNLLPLLAAACSIISLLAYITTTITTYAGAPAAINILLGVLALFTSGLRLLFDAYLSAQETTPQPSPTV